MVSSTSVGSIVAGLDGGGHDEAILQFAYGLAQDTGHSLRIVHAIRPQLPPPFAAQDASARSAVATLASRRRMTDMAHTAIAEQLAKTADGQPLPASITVEYGDPATLLLSTAGQQDVIVIGARGSRHARSPLLLGTVSQDVAVHANCPVILVPPPAD